MAWRSAYYFSRTDLQFGTWQPLLAINLRKSANHNLAHRGKRRRPAASTIANSLTFSSSWCVQSLDCANHPHTAADINNRIRKTCLDIAISLPYREFKFAPYKRTIR